MRIGLFIDTLNLGGAETMLLDLAKTLSDHKQTPVILHFGNTYIEKFSMQHKLESHIVPNHKDYKKIYRLPLFILKTASFLKKLNLHCIHSHLYGPITAMAPTAAIAKITHIGTLHDTHMIEDSPNRIWGIYLAAKLGTKLIAVSNPMRQFYIDTGKVANHTISYIANFSPETSATVPRELMRDKLGLNKEDIMVMSVGRLVHLKRFDLLIDAIDLLPKNIKVYIAGDGPCKDSLQQKSQSKTNANNIIFLNERNDIDNLLNAADIFALTSDTEGMSRSILEALSASLPVVATNVGGNIDLVKNDINGYVVPTNNSQAIANAITTISSSQSLRDSMSLNSHKLASDQFNRLNFLSKHINLYTKGTLEQGQ